MIKTKTKTLLSASLLAIFLVALSSMIISGIPEVDNVNSTAPDPFTYDPFDTEENTYQVKFAYLTQQVFYTDLPIKSSSIRLWLCGIESSTIVELHDPQDELIYSERGLSDEVDVRTVPVDESGVYTISISRTGDSDTYQFTTDSNNLYTYHICFDDNTNASIWVEVPSDTNFTLWNHDMDNYGEIRVYRPSGSLYGVFTGASYISPNSEWKTVDVISYNEPGLWRVTLTHLSGADYFLVDASCGGYPIPGSRIVEEPFLKLHVKKPTELEGYRLTPADAVGLSLKNASVADFLAINNITTFQTYSYNNYQGENCWLVQWCSSDTLLSVYINVTTGKIVGIDEELRSVFLDTGEGEYPSIPGIINGSLTVHSLYTYPCGGTGGHTEYVRIYDESGTIAEANWSGYEGNWQTITFEEPFQLDEGKPYNYTIRTGSYPQIIHAREWNAPGGKLTCTEFRDVNGNVYTDWIPAIRLE